MKKLVFLTMLLVIFGASPLFSAESLQPIDLTLRGPYGGSFRIFCDEVYPLGQGSIGGECTLTYNDLSVIPGYYFSGTLEIGFSYLESKYLWVDFDEGNSFQVKDGSGNVAFVVEFPVFISFEVELPNRFLRVIAPGTPQNPEGGEAVISINGQNIKATPDLVKYLLPIF